MKPGKKDRPQILCFLSGGTLLEREILQRGILDWSIFVQMKLFKVGDFNLKEFGNQFKNNENKFIWKFTGKKTCRNPGIMSS